MEAAGIRANSEGTGVDAEQSSSGVNEDLLLRLHGSQKQERTARAEVRRLARELALMRRLLHFAFRGQLSSPARSAPRPTAAAPHRGVPRVHATLLTGTVKFALDSCNVCGTHTALLGWAFLPVAGWDGNIATTTLIFRHGDTAYAAAAGKVARPDVAAHFATQPPEAAGGARNLGGAGFACEIVSDSLPAGVEWEIVLRLECAGTAACEQATGRRLRL